MTALKIERMGDHLGVTLPREVVERLGLSPDGALYLVDMGDGDFRLSRTSPEAERVAETETERQVRVGMDFMARYEATFHALAK